LCIASLKKLINRHREVIQQSSNKLDWEGIDNVTYLHEFDRLVQYVSFLMLVRLVLIVHQNGHMGLSNRRGVLS
jgi:hypothetical protein